jgi:hypothetical protein
MITIVFEFPSTYGTFRDALNLPEDHGLSEEELTVMQQARFDNWIAHIEAISQEPTLEA